MHQNDWILETYITTPKLVQKYIRQNTINGWIFLCIHEAFISIRVEILIWNLGIYKKDMFVGSSHAIVHSMYTSPRLWRMPLAGKILRSRYCFHICIYTSRFVQQRGILVKNLTSLGVR